MKTAIILPILDRIVINQVSFTSTECTLSADAIAGSAVMAKATMVVRNGTTNGCKSNSKPKSIQDALSASEHLTPIGYTELMFAIGGALKEGKDVFSVIEKVGKSAGWFLG